MPAATSLLMLAFEFPPLEVVGVRRSAGLARYLPEFGIAPVVITADEPSLAAWTGQKLGTTMLDAVVPVHRVACPPPAPAPNAALRRAWQFLLLGGDIGTCWSEALAREWPRLVESTAPAALYVSLPPFRLAPLALRLARDSRLPLILDYRDHWTQWGHVAYATPFHYAREMRDERECLEAAAAVVGVTEPLVRDLQEAHPSIDRAKFHVVANGWDDPDAARLARAPARPGVFVIGHAGRFYYSPEKRASVMEPWWRKRPQQWLQYTPRREDWLYRSPHFFFRALRTLLDRRPDLRPRVRVRLAGDVEPWLTAQIDHFGLQDVVECLGRLPHDACLAFEAECDALLITSVKVPEGRDYCIAGKTFEYLAAGRPIVGIVTDGAQRDFLRASGGAVIADADDAEGAARAIERLIEGVPAPPRNEAVIAAHHRRETARRMAAIVQQVAHR